VGISAQSGASFVITSYLKNESNVVKGEPMNRYDFTKRWLAHYGICVTFIVVLASPGLGQTSLRKASFGKPSWHTSARAGFRPIC